MSNVAPSMSDIVSAISPTTSTLNRLRPRPVVVPAPDLSGRPRSTWLARSDGSAPNARLVTAAASRLNAKLRQLSETAIAPSPGTSRVIRQVTRSNAHIATTIPSAAPASAQSIPSSSVCRMTLERRAPSAKARA